MNVLLVDDSSTMRTIQKKVLAALGQIECVEAADGIEALCILGSTPGGFDLVLIDWNMPNMDGITLVRKIRASNLTTPLIMVSTEADKAKVIEAIHAGVNNYVVTPFTPRQLIERVRQTMARAKHVPCVGG